MSPRTHLCLRIAALTMLVCAGLWPRARPVTPADELSRATQDGITARTAAVHVETAAATLVSAPGSAKLVVAQSDDSELTN